MVKDMIVEMKAKLAEMEAALEAELKAQYDLGVAEGKASMLGNVSSEPGAVAPSDKLYSQAELDAAVAAAVQPLSAKIAALEQQVIDLDARILEKVAEGVKEFKAELLAKYQAQQVAESQGETGFADLLK